MKKLILVILLICNLFADEKKDAVEMFMFKVGITSLTYDLENEKKNIFNNSSEIKKLKEDIKYLLEQNIKSKLVIKDDTSIVIDNDNIKKLKIENKKLKEKIKELESKKTTKYKIATIYDDKASLSISPFPNSKVVRYIYKTDILEIQWCNRYGWCKLNNKEEYIPKFKLSFQGNNI